jgi:RNA polymerase sigma factor (sigma-70 family)
MPSDLQHLQRYATTGDAHAFRELVQAHGAMVHATALRVTRDAAAAQDVAQETFLELARKAGGITQSVAAWLHRVSWNRACDVVRRETARKRVEKAMAETWHTDREATWADIEPHVDEALNELPKELREVLVLYFLEGRTQAEVARYLGKNQATVSRAIERGISAMREALRSRGVIAGAGLVALLAAQPVQAMPVALQASLGKLPLTGICTTSAITPSASVLTTTLVTMTATTKALLITGAIAAATLPFVLHHPANKSLATNAPKTVRQSTPEIPAVPQGTNQPKRYRPITMPESVRRKADGVAARHRGMTKDQFEQSAEIKQLGQRFFRHLEPPEFQKKVQQAIEALKAVKGIEHGTLNFDLHDLTSPNARAWLEAALSDDPQPAQDYVMNLLDGAVFEFAFDPSSDTSSDGLTVKGENPSRSPTDKQSRD